MLEFNFKVGLIWMRPRELGLGQRKEDFSDYAVGQRVSWVLVRADAVYPAAYCCEGVADPWLFPA